MKPKAKVRLPSEVGGMLSSLGSAAESARDFFGAAKKAGEQLLRGPRVSVSFGDDDEPAPDEPPVVVEVAEKKKR